jgi:hypothetical protein
MPPRFCRNRILERLSGKAAEAEVKQIFRYSIDKCIEKSRCRSEYCLERITISLEDTIMLRERLSLPFTAVLDNSHDLVGCRLTGMSDSQL